MIWKRRSPLVYRSGGSGSRAGSEKPRCKAVRASVARDGRRGGEYVLSSRKVLGRERRAEVRNISLGTRSIGKRRPAKQAGTVRNNS